MRLRRPPIFLSLAVPLFSAFGRATSSDDVVAAPTRRRVQIYPGYRPCLCSPGFLRLIPIPIPDYDYDDNGESSSDCPSCFGSPQDEERRTHRCLGYNRYDDGRNTFDREAAAGQDRPSPASPRVPHPEFGRLASVTCECIRADRTAAYRRDGMVDSQGGQCRPDSSSDSCVVRSYSAEAFEPVDAPYNDADADADADAPIPRPATDLVPQPEFGCLSAVSCQCIRPDGTTYRKLGIIDSDVGLCLPDVRTDTCVALAFDAEGEPPFLSVPVVEDDNGGEGGDGQIDAAAAAASLLPDLLPPPAPCACRVDEVGAGGAFVLENFVNVAGDCQVGCVPTPSALSIAVDANEPASLNASSPLASDAVLIRVCSCGDDSGGDVSTIVTPIGPNYVDEDDCPENCSLRSIEELVVQFDSLALSPAIVVGQGSIGDGGGGGDDGSGGFRSGGADPYSDLEECPSDLSATSTSTSSPCLSLQNRSCSWGTECCRIRRSDGSLSDCTCGPSMICDCDSDSASYTCYYTDRCAASEDYGCEATLSPPPPNGTCDKDDEGGNLNVIYNNPAYDDCSNCRRYSGRVSSTCPGQGWDLTYTLGSFRGAVVVGICPNRLVLSMSGPDDSPFAEAEKAFFLKIADKVETQSPHASSLGSLDQLTIYASRALANWPASEFPIDFTWPGEDGSDEPTVPSWFNPNDLLPSSDSCLDDPSSGASNTSTSSTGGR